MIKQLLVFVFLTLLATAGAPLFGQVAWVQGPVEIRVGLLNETVAPEGLEVTIGGENVPVRFVRLGFALKTLHLHLDNAAAAGKIGEVRVRMTKPELELVARKTGVWRMWLDPKGKEVWRGWLPDADLARAEKVMRGTEEWSRLSARRTQGGRLAEIRHSSASELATMAMKPETTEIDSEARKRGQVLFFGKGGCDACHRLNGKGKEIGPSLAELGSADAVRVAEKILDPFSSVHPEYLHRQITFGNGTSTIGVVRRDGGKVRVADHTGSVQTYPAAAVQVVYNMAGTIMPPQATDGWTGEERAALVRFLCAGEPPDPPLAGDPEVRHLLVATFLLARLEAVELTATQRNDFDVLSRELRREIDTLRATAGIDKLVMSRRDKAHRALKKLRLEPEDYWNKLKEKAALNDAQLQAFRKTQDRYQVFKSSVDALLTDVQRQSLKKIREEKTP